MASAAAASSGASSQVSAVTPQVTLQGRRALARSKGIMRISLDELGPALFNRQGAPTSGRHCMNLAKRILTVEGFATYRYTAGYCHEPDPQHPDAVTDHGNKMAERDSLLPRLSAKPRFGVFAKTHLVTLLQLYNGGQMPELKVWVAANRTAEEREELEDVLQYGIYMHVFPWEAVRDAPDDMKALMASDNFDHGHGLTDSELRCIAGMRQAILNLPIPPASSQVDVVMAHVQRLSGQRWHHRDLDAFWDFAQTTLDGHLELLMEIWMFGECEDMLKVDSAFFGALAKVSAKHQWCRCALAVKQFLSDRDTECLLVGGRHVAAAVDVKMLRKMAASNRSEEQVACSQDLEDFLNEMMKQYFMPWAHDWMKSPYQREAWAKAFGALLLKVSNYLCKGEILDREARVKMETKLRLTLEVNRLDELPGRLYEDGLKPSIPERETVTLSARNAFTGSVALPMKRKAAEAGLPVNAEVVRRTANNDAVPNPAPGRIEVIAEDGLHVRWENGNVEILQIADLVLHVKKKASSQEDDHLDKSAMKWAVAGSEDNAKMCTMIAQVTLYNLYTSQSTAHQDIVVLPMPEELKEEQGLWQIVALRDFKPRTLFFLPWNTGIFADAGIQPPHAVALMLLVQPEKQPETQMKLWLKAKNTPKTLAAHQERATVLVPFWMLSGKPVAEIAEGMCELKYEKLRVTVPQPGVLSKGVRVGRSRVQLLLPVMTNEIAVARGQRLVVCGVVPCLDDMPCHAETPK